MREIHTEIIFRTVSHREVVVSTEGKAKPHSDEKEVEAMIDNGVNNRIRDQDLLGSARTGNPEASDDPKGDFIFRD